MGSSGKILVVDRPSPPSFLGIYLAYALPLISILFVFSATPYLPPGVVNALVHLGAFLGLGKAPAQTILHIAIMVGAGILLWLKNITLRPAAYYAATLIMAFIVSRYFLIDFSTSLEYVSILMGIIGILGTEIYRRSFKYTLTDLMLVIEGGVLGRRERSIPLSKIADLVTVRPLLGRFFGYAHIIPLTPTQLGMGDDASLAMIGGKVPKIPVSTGIGGMRSRRTERPDPSNVVYGIRRWREFREKLAAALQAREEYSRRTAEGVEEISRKLDKIIKD